MAWGGRDVYVDLGAERLLAAEKRGRRIAIEIKGFQRESDIEQLEQALGQFVLYRAIMARREPDRVLFLAVPEEAARKVFDAPVGQLMREDQGVRIVTFDPEAEAVVRWII